MTESQWFKRVWTLQEAVLAQELSLQVGCSTTSWETVVPVHILLKDMAKGSDVSTSLDEVAKTVSTILELRLNQIITDRDSLTRSSFMDMTTRKASDERDYVYGRLELYQQGAMAFLEADSCCVVCLRYAGCPFIFSQRRLQLLK